jgi:hypothetical protein
MKKQKSEAGSQKSVEEPLTAEIAQAEMAKRAKRISAMKSLAELVQAEEQKGNIVVAGFEGLMSMNLEEFIKQPTEGMLYDLNRDKATVLTFIEDKKWVNDYAVGLVIAKLKEKLEEKK